jgi:predicted permease
VLLATAVVLLQTLWRVEAIDPGFRPEGVLTMRTVLPTPKYEPVTRRMQFYSRVIPAVRALPGVVGAAYTTGLPLVMRGGIWPVAVDGKPVQPGDRQAAILRVVTPGYFGAMGIRLMVGRDFADSDAVDGPRVAVVSDSFVRQYWSGKNPLGRRLLIALAERTVVGVVGDVRVRGRERESEPQVYLPPTQQDDASVSVYAPKDLVVRGPGDLSALLPAIRRIVHQADPEQPISEIRALTDVLDEESAPRLVQLRILAAFAALAFVLAATGIHAVLSYAVVDRRREIGVRIALGATRLRILRDVAGEALALAALGTLAGLAGAWAVERTMRSLLVGADSANLAAGTTICAMALLMTLAGVVVPALRAVRVNPTDAIRSE